MAALTTEQYAQLGEPLDPAIIKTREQGGRSFSYLEGYTAIANANRIFGFDGWSYAVGKPEVQALSNGQLVVTTIVEVRVGEAARQDVGVSVIVAENAQSFETAFKGAATDGLKRALRSFGAQFGNDLYEKTQSAANPRPFAGRSAAPTVHSVRPAASDDAGDEAVAPPAADAEGHYFCADCSAEIEAWTNKQGKLFTPEQLARTRINNFGRQLCARCTGKERKKREVEAS